MTTNSCMAWLFLKRRSPRSLLEHLVKQKEYYRIIATLDTHPDCLCRPGDPKRALLSILQYRPPLSVVREIVRTLGPPIDLIEDICDDSGCNAVHLAAKHGCDFRIVDFLLRGNVLPAVRRDDHDRTPLHHACMQRKYSANAIIMVATLLDFYPMAACLHDIEGSTPIQLARRYGAPLEVTQPLVLCSASLGSTACGPSVCPSIRVSEEDEISSIGNESISPGCSRDTKSTCRDLYFL